jgi:hypothetical protein
VSGTDAASASTSAELRMIPSPSRSHCTTAPPMKTLPSSAYSVRLPRRHATVASSLWRETGALVPVFWSMKQPVPYVFLVRPASVHSCPKSAACWSPAMPAIGTPASPATLASPYTSLDARTSGSTLRGTRQSCSSSSSQARSRC